MNIPEGAHRRVLSLCEVDLRANSAKSPNYAVTPHNKSLHIKSEMLSSTFQIVITKPSKHAGEIGKRPLVALQKGLLRRMEKGTVECLAAGHAAHREALQ